MKPLPIADYLDRPGRASTERASPRREVSPFRPRSLSSLQNGEPPSIPAFDRKTEPGGVENRRGEERPDGAAWDPKPIPLDSAARQLQTAREAAKPKRRP
jgi:hypothetical protein